MVFSWWAFSPFGVLRALCAEDTNPSRLVSAMASPLSRNRQTTTIAGGPSYFDLL